MLSQLTIQNFAIVDHLEIDFQHGMTAITGETGAGKSIAIDALGLCLGDRIEGNPVRKGSQRADLLALFTLDINLTANQPAISWLKDHQLDSDIEGAQHYDCLLRRVISEDGRSRGFINGTPVTLNQLRELGDLLIQIHGQHAHQTLLKNETQRKLLDAYLDQDSLLQKMRTSYKNWSDSCKLRSQQQAQLQERLARMELIKYQLEELDEFAPILGEYELLDEEYKKRSNSEDLLSNTQQALSLLQDDEHANILSMLNHAKQQLQSVSKFDKSFLNIIELLEQADIQIHEACNELRHSAESLEIDPHRLYELEKRLSKQMQLARKHQVTPENLPNHYQLLKEESDALNDMGLDQEKLTEQIEAQYQTALQLASKLNSARRKAAKELSERITHHMHELSMPHGVFEILIAHEPEYLSAQGADKIEFVVSTNPGQAVAPLSKVASGGELSRISLALQVITAQKMDMPALIFDEVDVGISGPTAAIVGKLLRQLGETTQVLCVTHLPQVAAAAHNHFFVSKTVLEENKVMMTSTEMVRLDESSRLDELARLLGGEKITDNTLANARELIAHYA
uniref:DNA repair protein RecN n=1 Tax=Coetzeea brasiliensis TaxID=1812101 RepID=A0A142C9M9_9GAMM|nr:DNA recombination/repair protein [Coetzeea brasiliensis]